MDTAIRPAIETRGLRKSFDDVIAVDGIDLEEQAGSFFGFLGPNGAGKSTTIGILTGMLLPSAGTASILGHDIVDDPDAADRQIADFLTIPDWARSAASGGSAW